MQTKPTFPTERNSPIPSARAYPVQQRPTVMPVILQGRGQAISFATILTAVAAFGGYQISPGATAAGQDIAVMQTQIKDLSVSMMSLEDKVDTQISTQNVRQAEQLRVLVRLETSQKVIAELLKETRDDIKSIRRRNRRQ